MIQYFLANTIASFVPTSRVTATKPDARLSSTNVSLFAMDFIKRERSGIGFGMVMDADAETGLVSVWNTDTEISFKLSASLHVAGMLSDCIEMNGTTEISFQYSGRSNGFKKIQGNLEQINEIWY